jgi:transaldolase
MTKLSELYVKIFADGADLAGMLEMYRNPLIQGFTTNPTLMRKAGIKDYREFAHTILDAIPDRPISFEVFSDEPECIRRQAAEIASWGENVYVKVPVTTTNKEPLNDVVQSLSQDGVKLNVTALMTLAQVETISECLAGGAPSCVSVFAGRVADTGRDPLPLMEKAVEILKNSGTSELIWASPRELLNIFHADSIGCHIITVTNDTLKKLPLVGKDLEEYSQETVQMFFNDAAAAGYSLEGVPIEASSTAGNG